MTRLKHIAGLTKLEELDLYGVKLTDAGIAHLKDLKEMRKLILLGAPDYRREHPRPGRHDSTARIEPVPQPHHERRPGETRRVCSDLTAVDLRYSRVTASGVETLRAAVPSCEIEFVGAAPTKNAKRPSSLVATAQKLNLEATEADDLTLQKLRNRKDIRELNLSYTTVTDAGLANLQSIPSLRVLRLAGTQINGSGLSTLKSVVDLDLSGVPIRSVPVLPAIERLNLSDSDISDAAIADLAKLPALQVAEPEQHRCRRRRACKRSATMTNLRELGLNYGRFTDKGLDALKTLTGLKRLDLVRTRTGEAAMAVDCDPARVGRVESRLHCRQRQGFALLQGMPKLRELHLDSVDVGDESIDVIASMPNLQTVNLYHTTVTAGRGGAIEKGSAQMPGDLGPRFGAAESEEDVNAQFGYSIRAWSCVGVLSAPRMSISARAGSPIPIFRGWRKCAICAASTSRSPASPIAACAR